MANLAKNKTKTLLNINKPDPEIMQMTAEHSWNGTLYRMYLSVLAPLEYIVEVYSIPCQN